LNKKDVFFSGGNPAVLYTINPAVFYTINPAVLYTIIKKRDK
jgi:hypothetical protein